MKDDLIRRIDKQPTAATAPAGAAAGSGGGSSGSVAFANPTATIGLAATNGSSGSAMRSDSAPALSQAIVPTWSGRHTFSLGIFAPSIGPSSTQLHTLPAVASDTFALLAAVQTLTNKTLGNTNTVTLKDTLFTLQDDGDTTKQLRLQLSGITTATTRTLTVPDASDTIAVLAASQALTNKTYNGLTLSTTTGTFTLTNGKTLTVQNTLTLSGTDGKALTLTGALTIGADTSITGGGTLAMGGFTLTAPATGTIALGAGSVSQGSANDASGANHTHAAVTTNGAAINTILATDAGGSIDLLGNISADGGSLTLGSDVQLIRQSTNTISLGIGDILQSNNYISGVRGWQITDTRAEFDNISARGELRASVFTVGEKHLVGGTALILTGGNLFADTASI